ncbi:MAG: hypothetical protein IPM57_01210 [Oligoflexia bacterium]|nr:hypothetical protein [Oligoflexia bacterium]
MEQDRCVVSLLKLVGAPAIEFPAGYRLSSRNTQLALELPITKDLTLALYDASKFIEGIGEQQLMLLARVMHEKPHLQAQSEFPQTFFEQNFSHMKINQNKLKEIFNLFSQILPTNFSPETVLVLAYGFLEVKAQKTVGSDPHFYRELLKENLDVFDYDPNTSGEVYLEQTRNFLNTHPGLFARVAKYLLPTSVSKYEKIKYEKEIDEQMSTKGLTTTIDQKIQIATDVAPLKIRRALRMSFDNVFYTRPEINKSVHNKRWQYMEVYLLMFIVEDMVKEARKKGADNSTELDFVRESLAKLVQQEKMEEFNYLNKVIHQFLGTTSGRETFQWLQPNEIKMQVEIKLSEMGSRIRSITKTYQRELQEREDEARDQNRLMVRQVETDKVEVPLIDNIRVAQPSGRLLKNARLAEQNAKINVQQNAIFEKPKEGSIDIKDLTLQNAEANHPYYFKWENQEIQYIVLSESIIKEFRRRLLDIEPWVKAFMHGRTGKYGFNGLKRLTGSTSSKWEIKRIGNGLRVILELDKTNHTWHWLILADHNLVDLYR